MASMHDARQLLYQYSAVLERLAHLGSVSHGAGCIIVRKPCAESTPLKCAMEINDSVEAGFAPLNMITRFAPLMRDSILAMYEAAPPDVWVVAIEFNGGVWVEHRRQTVFARVLH